MLARGRTPRSRVLAVTLLAPCVLLAGFTGCGGGGASPDQIGGGGFYLLETAPPNNGRIYLNESIRLTFTNPVDLASATFNSIAFFVRDVNGNPLTESVVGTFRHGRDANDVVDPRIIEFVPKTPTNDTYSDGGFRPARQYVLSVVHATNNAAPTLRDRDGRPIATAARLRGMMFTTATGSTPQELFLDRRVGGPRVLSVDASPKFDDRVSLNDLGGEPVEFAIRFDQALNPRSSNVPLRQPVEPVRGNARRQGRIFLEYDDPQLGDKQWIRAAVEMPINDLVSSTVVLRPDGILPNDAEIRVIVEATLEDISGESNIREQDYERVVATFKTERRHTLQFDAVVFDFENSDYSDPEAAFRDPVAELANGELKAAFDYEGVETPLNFEPTAASNILSTDFTQLVPSNGLPFDVVGGVFRINDIKINKGITVSGVGTNAMVWLASGDVTVDGHLHVNGGQGGRVDGLNGANFPTAGGQGVCTGGNGGKGSPNTSNTSPKGEDGFGPYQRPSFGGEGGQAACGPSASYGSGGGGGSHAQVGDADFEVVWGADWSAKGKGGDGAGGNGRIGGAAGPKLFVDKDDGNDFWGRTLDSNGRVVFGEMRTPSGGGGGGGGGDRSRDANCSTGPNFFLDSKAGGGGGGGGCLIIKALGTITIGPEGRISADGGNGGGGMWAGSSGLAGSGGGGAAGMVVLEAARVVIYQRGGRWAQKDTSFAISADSGIGAATSRPRKYMSGGRPNRGGFGGMGLVQILTPAGRDEDRTGNVQDDNIIVLDANHKEVANKLDWLRRGDIRPDPVLLPATYGRMSSWASRYVSTGASVRRVVKSTAGEVRATTAVPLLEPSAKDYGPDYAFAGLITSGPGQGYLSTNEITGRVDFIARRFGGLDRLPIDALESRATTHRGLFVHRVSVDSDLLPGAGHLANTSLRFFNTAGSAVAGDFRVLANDEKNVFIDARDGVLPRDVATFSILDKFFDVVTDGNPGLGGTYEIDTPRGPRRYPIANVQIGFAFHLDPANPAITGGSDAKRFPRKIDQYIYDLDSVGTSSPRELLRQLHYPFVKMRVRFNLNYDHTSPETRAGAHPVNALSQRPALRFVRLPFAY